MSFNPRLGKQSFLLNKDQKVIDFNFKIYKDTDVKVYLIPKGQFPNDTTDILTLATSYSVSVNGDSGGTVTLTSSVTVNKDDKLVIIRRLPVTRETQYVAGGTLYNDTLDNDQDYQTYLILDLYQDILGTLRLPLSASGESLVLENIEPNAYLRWNDTAQKILSDTKLPDALEQVILLEQKVQKNADLASNAILTISTIFEQLGKTYLGEQATDPTKDFNDNPLLGGAVYYNSTYNKFRVYDGNSWFDAITIEKATEQDVIDATDNFKYVTPKALAAFTGGGGTSLYQYVKFIRNDTDTGYITEKPFDMPKNQFFVFIIESSTGIITNNWVFTVKENSAHKLEILDADINALDQGDLRTIKEFGVTDPTLIKTFKDLVHINGGTFSIEDIIFNSPVQDGEHIHLDAIKKRILDFTGVDFTNHLLEMSVGYAYFYGSQPSNVRKIWEYGMPISLYDKILIGATESQSGGAEGGILQITQTTTDLVANVLRGGTYPESFSSYIHAELKNVSIELLKE